uniref:Uncharacterized protein n=1 Tax=Cacopsylla melanoneura TaxID=428564 RepID=A0A8D8SBA2_9HEMI
MGFSIHNYSRQQSNHQCGNIRNDKQTNDHVWVWVKFLQQTSRRVLQPASRRFNGNKSSLEPFIGNKPSLRRFNGKKPSLRWFSWSKPSLGGFSWSKPAPRWVISFSQTVLL